MPELLPNAVLIGIVAALSAIVLRFQAGRPRLSFFTLVLIGVAAAYLVTPALAYLAQAWRTTPALPGPPEVTSGRLFLGAWAAFAVLFVANSKARPKRVPLWAGLLIGVAVAALFPPLIDGLTGSYQRASLRDDVNHCTRGMTGQVQPREVANICDEPIIVGLCMPGEVNPAPCAQSFTIAPGGTATLDPGEESLSSLPGNPGGLTVVACRPPARPSRMGTTIGRGYEGVCLPAG
jgi:ABC-type Fe3+-siderophore transport system permease subunit